MLYTLHSGSFHIDGTSCTLYTPVVSILMAQAVHFTLVGSDPVQCTVYLMCCDQRGVGLGGGGRGGGGK